jgi:hypothetical protein
MNETKKERIENQMQNTIRQGKKIKMRKNKLQAI